MTIAAVRSPSESTSACATSGSRAPCASALRAAQQPTGSPSGGVMSTRATPAERLNGAPPRRPRAPTTATLSPCAVVAIARTTQTMPSRRARRRRLGSRSGRSRKWIWPTGCPASTRSPRSTNVSQRPRLRREQVVVVVGRAARSPPARARAARASRPRPRARRSGGARSRGRSARSGASPRCTCPPPPSSVETTILPCRSASPTSRPGAGDVDVDEVVVGVPREHRVDHLPALLGVVDPVHLRPRRAEAAAPAAVHVDDDVGAREEEAREEVGELLVGRPVGRAREGAVEVRAATARAACRRARRRARRTGTTISCPGTSPGSVSRASRSAATCPSGSSPWTPPNTSAVGPSPPLIETIGMNRCDQPLVLFDRGSSSRPTCLPGASRSIEQWTGESGTRLGDCRQSCV